MQCPQELRGSLWQRLPDKAKPYLYDADMVRRILIMVRWLAWIDNKPPHFEIIRPGNDVGEPYDQIVPKMLYDVIQ
jgi:hypothetical protein